MLSKVIIEKYKKWNYVNYQGYYVWENRYGDIIRVEDENGISIHNIVITDREALEDLKAFGIDVEGQLANFLAQEIGQEIDRQIIANLLQIENGGF